MIHQFPCQDAFASNRWINFLYVRCQVLQLLTLEAASRKRLSLSLSLRSKPLQSNAFAHASMPCCRQLAAQAGLAADKQEYCRFAPHTAASLENKTFKPHRGSFSSSDSSGSRSLTSPAHQGSPLEVRDGMSRRKHIRKEKEHPRRTAKIQPRT